MAQGLTPGQQRQFSSWIENYKMTHGRAPSQDTQAAWLQANIQANIATETERKALGLQERQVALSERATEEQLRQSREAIEAGKGAAKVQGIANLATTGYALDKLTGGHVAKGLKAIGGALKPAADVSTALDTVTAVPTAGIPATSLEAAPVAAALDTTTAVPTAGMPAVSLEATALPAAGEVPLGLEAAEITATTPTSFGQSFGATATRFGPAVAGAAMVMYHDDIADYVEEQVGTSARHVAGIGQRTVEGALIGATVGGVPGAVAGASIGAVVGVVEESWGWLEEQTSVGQAGEWLDEQGICIIITACTHPYSFDVAVAREYRDTYMGTRTRRGYYMIAERVIPYVKKHRAWVKRNIVDRWVSVAEWKLDLTHDYPKPLAWVLSVGFLKLCNLMGRMRVSFARVNGEVV